MSRDPLDEIGSRLSNHLHDRYGVEVAVVRDAVAAPPCVHLQSTEPAWGDPYSGYLRPYRATLDGFVPPGGDGHPLVVIVDFTVHDLSGQTDTWDVTVRGAPLEERSRYEALFDARSYPVTLSQTSRCRFRFE
jgi:hypothetical protein